MRQIRSGNNIREVGTHAEALNRVSSTFLDGNIRRDTGIEATTSETYENVPDTELTIDVSRPSRVALFGYMVGGGNDGLALATLTVQLRIDATGYGTEMFATTVSAQSGTGSSGYVLTLKPGKYTFGMQYKTSDAALGARIEDRQIMYFIFNNDYTGT